MKTCADRPTAVVASSQAEVAHSIADRLAPFVREAEAAGLGMLVYLLEMLKLEVEGTMAFKADRS